MISSVKEFLENVTHGILYVNLFQKNIWHTKCQLLVSLNKCTEVHTYIGFGGVFKGSLFEIMKIKVV